MKLRFDRYPRIAPRPVTNRRIKAAQRALQRERDKFPLLADWVVEQQPTPQERVERFRSASIDRIASTRSHRAKLWRQARALLKELHPDVRDRIVESWNAHSMPADPSYLLDHIHCHAACRWPHPFYDKRKIR